MIAFLSNWLLLYPIAFSLYVAMQLSEATADGRKATASVLAIRTVIFVLFVFAILAVGCRASLLTIVWCILCCVIGTILLIKQSKLKRETVTMTVLSCRDLPQIRRVASYFEQEHGGLFGSKLRTFRMQLDRGVSWAVALETSRFCRGSYERLATRLADRFGSSSTLTQDLNAPLRVEIEMERLLSRLSMLLWIVFFGPFFALYQVYIVPTLLKMLTEFGMEVPPALQAITSLRSMGWLFGVVALFALALFACALLLWMFPRLTSQMPFRVFCNAYYRCLGFVALSRVSEHTSDLTEACRQTAELVPVPHIAQQFRTAVACLEGGQSPADAFTAARLIQDHRIGDFSSILDTAGLAWATNQLANVEVERMLYRYALVIQFLVVAFTLIFAVLVGLVAIGMFQVLSTMVQSLA